MQHRVRISFDRPPDMEVTLTDEEYEASQNEYSWEEFYSLMETKMSDHLFAYTVIDDVKDI